MAHSIGSFSTLTGISIYTLRYYEKAGLLKPNRLANGQRRYSQKDVAWIEFIKRLKETNMSIKGIKQYADLRALGAETLQERMELLISHHQQLKTNLARMQENLSSLEQKIEFYQQEIDHITR